MVRISIMSMLSVYVVIFLIFGAILTAGFMVFKNTLSVTKEMSSHGAGSEYGYLAQGSSIAILFLFTAASVLFLVGTVKWMRPKRRDD